MMADRSHWDPEMAAFTAEQEKAAAAYPPVKVELPLAPHRHVNDILGRRTAVGGPQMAETTDRWLDATGRRIFCRIYRPSPITSFRHWCISMVAAGCGQTSIRMTG